MTEILVKPSFTMAVEEGRWTYRWKDKKRFVDELINRGLKESQVDKVWRMYTDRDFILRHGDKGCVGSEYVITRAHMSGMARELGIHGKSRSKTAIKQLKQLVLQAGCFVIWVNPSTGSGQVQLVQFASPMFYTKEVLSYADND